VVRSSAASDVYKRQALLWHWAQFPDAATPAQERAYGLTVYRPGGAEMLHVTCVLIYMSSNVQCACFLI
jgi:hypothetical protein